MKILSDNQGYIALISVLMISAVVLAIGVSISLYGASDLKKGFTENKSAQAFNYAEACVDEGVYRLKTDWSSTSTALIFNRGSCIINANVAGSQATIFATGTAEVDVSDYVRVLKVIVSNNFEVISWEEPN